MTLSRWSRLLSLAAVAGVLVLALLAGWALRAQRTYDARTEALVALQARADALSAAADALLVGASEGATWNGFRANADALVRDLAPFDTTGGPGALAVAATQHLVASVEAIAAPRDGQPPAAGDVLGPLGVPVAIARAMQDVAAIGVELDGAFDALLLADFGRGASATQRLASLFVAAALAFAALSVVALEVLRRRVGAQVVALAELADRAAQGQRAERAAEGRTDELGRLARSLNALLDAWSASEHALRMEREALAYEKESLIASQRIAHVATWSWAPPDEAVAVSTEAFAILGRPPAANVPLETLAAAVHDEDRARLRDEVLEPLWRGTSVAAVVRFVRPDGEVRTLRVHGERRASEGSAPKIFGTVQDVTDEYARRRVADTQARLLVTAGQVARLGGWSVDVRTWTMAWSDVVCEIHEEPHGTAPPPERGIEYYAPEYRDRIRAVFGACVRDGTPYDEELQIVTSRGRRVWVRTTGTAVRDESGAIVRVEGAFQDIDARKRAEERASASEGRLRQTIESLAEPFLLVARDGTIVFANEAAAAPVRTEPAALVGRAVGTVYRGSARPEDRAALARAFRSDEPHLAEVWAPDVDRWFEVRIDPIDGVFAFQARDVTERRSMLERLRRHEHELRTSRDALAVALQAQRATLDALPAHVAVLDERGDIEYVNDGWRAFAEANGLLDPHHGVGANYLAVVDRAAGADETARATATGLRRVMSDAADAFDLEYPCHGPQTEAWFRLSARRVKADEDGAGRVVVMHVDITERMLAERAIERVAHHDALTSSFSRAGFVRHLGAALAHHWRPHCVVATIDLQDFRSINDAHGFEAGDAVLRTVAARLAEAVGEDGMVARVGGDSFAVCFHPSVLQDGAERGVRHLVQRVFDAPIDVDGFALRLDVAAGFTTLDAELRSVEELLREAEVALYTGVNAADGGIAAYTSELDAESRARARTTAELKEALARAEFELYFQPKVDLPSGAIVAAEALIRWNHPEHGLVAPGAFVTIAEQCGLIVPIGSWVLDEACRILARWRSEDLPRVRIAVNVSVRQLVHGDFRGEVNDAVARHGVDPDDLTLEITESVYGSESVHLHEQLDGLHELGVRLALDDFGTGFSSLQYLNAYRFDEVKIDRSFVRDMVRDRYSRNVIETILGIARAIGADAVAEGVETERQRDALTEMGCRTAQGYFFGAPVPEDDFRWMLRNLEP